MASCGLSPLPQEAARLVRREGVTVSAHVAGVRRCHSPSCPVCGPALSARRAGILQPQLAGLEARGWRLWLMTLTIRHHRGDDLPELIRLLMKAWQQLRKGRGGLSVPELEFVRGLDLTLGGPNGDHPHLHVVIALGPDHADTVVIAALLSRWKAITVKMGVRAADAGLDAQRTTSAAEAVAYATSLQKPKGTPALEVVGSAVKKGGVGRTMFDLSVAAVEDDDAEALAHWRRGAAALKGARIVGVSRGLTLQGEDEPGTGDVIEPVTVAEFTREGLRSVDAHLGAVLAAAIVSTAAGQAALRSCLGPPGRLWRPPGSNGPASRHAQQAYATATRSPPPPLH